MLKKRQCITESTKITLEKKAIVKGDKCFYKPCHITLGFWSYINIKTSFRRKIIMILGYSLLTFMIYDP